MPTERFMNLSEEKKRRISEAVILEFQRTSYGELQMAKIARMAQISRGSLYTYFTDKEDMFLFALSQTWRNVLSENQDKLVECRGDFWEMQIATLERHFQICRSNQIYRLLYFASDHEAIPCGDFWKKKNLEYQEYKKWIYRHMDLHGFETWTEEEVDVLQDTCQSILMVSVQQYLSDMSEEEAIKEAFKKKLWQIKKHMSRNKCEEETEA